MCKYKLSNGNAATATATVMASREKKKWNGWTFWVNKKIRDKNIFCQKKYKSIQRHKHFQNFAIVTTKQDESNWREWNCLNSFVFYCIDLKPEDNTHTECACIAIAIYTSFIFILLYQKIEMCWTHLATKRSCNLQFANVICSKGNPLKIRQNVCCWWFYIFTEHFTASQHLLPNWCGRNI